MSSPLTTDEIDDLVGPAAEGLDRYFEAIGETARMHGRFADWRNTIDVDRLDIGSGTECVIGQLVPILGLGTGDGWFAAIQKIGRVVDLGVMHAINSGTQANAAVNGGDIYQYPGSAVADAVAAQLTEAWRTYLEADRVS